MRNYRIGISECGEILREANLMLRDKRVGFYDNKFAVESSSFLSRYKESIRQILHFANMNHYLTLNQVGFLKKMCENYGKVKKFNLTYEGNFSDLTITLLEEVINFAEPYAIKNTNLKSKINLVEYRLKQIKEGEYFWDFHIRPAQVVLNQLKKEDVGNYDLEQRVEKILERTTIRES